MDNTSSSKAIPFLDFQIVQKNTQGARSPNFLALLTHKRLIPTQEGFPNRRRDHPQNSKKRKKTSPTKPLSLHNGEVSDLWIPHLNDKDNTYLLKPNPSSEFGPKLTLFPTRPPKQRSLFLVAHKNSKWSSLGSKLKIPTLRLHRETLQRIYHSSLAVTAPYPPHPNSLSSHPTITKVSPPHPPPNHWKV